MKTLFIAAVALAAPALSQEKAAEAPKPAAPGPPKPSSETTPMAERTVRFAILDKQNGKARDYIAHPGEVVTAGRLTVHVRACEATPPWERPWTGAFLQVDEQPRRGPRRRIFSGWLFAESPSINPVQHQYYDVWVKSCTMRFPEIGPDTVVVGKAPASKAPKSATTSSASANRTM